MNRLKEIKALLFAQPVLAENEIFQVKVATTEEEIQEVYKLRYRIFTVEQGQNQGAAEFETDTDIFDECCVQLIVKRISDNVILGTYRVHYGTVAETSGLGFYSETEYDISGLHEIAEDCIEMGRSCVAPEARDGAAMALLWKGVSELLRRSARRWLVGCVSLEEVPPYVSWGLYRYFQNSGKISKTMKAVPHDDYRVPPADEAEVAAFAADTRAVLHSLPPLFKGYLRMGAVICGEPVWDRAFGSVDFFIALDVSALPERYRRHFDVVDVSKHG